MRNYSTSALILSTQISGENNRRVTILSPDDGVFFATLYGGPKSRLRSLVSPMNSGIIYLYKDEVKNQIKITDFDVKNYHLSFRENLFKTYAAAFATEILIKTKCAGSPADVWSIVNGFLDGMELSSEENSRLGFVRFLWRYLSLLGVRPDSSKCCRCSSSLHSTEFNRDSLSAKYAFLPFENGFACPNCIPYVENEEIMTLSKSAVTYLEAIASLSAKDVRKIAVSFQTFNEMKQIAFYLIETACGTKLNTLESTVGIL